jgi:membrane-bound acyltransferase YfiQ involved in biofilm formation
LESHSGGLVERAWHAAAFRPVIDAYVLSPLGTIHPSFLPASNSCLISFAYACMLFVLFFHFNRRLRSRPVLRFLASSSAVYLVHGVIERTAFDAVWPLGGDAAVAAPLVVILAGAAVIYLWVERPLLAAGHPWHAG